MSDLRPVEINKWRDPHVAMLIEHVPVVLWTTDSDLVITSVEGHALLEASIVGESIVGITVGRLIEMFEPVETSTGAHERALRGERGTYEAQVGARTFRVQVRPRFGHDGRPVGTIGVALDITDARWAEEHLRFITGHDPLTGLPNRLGIVKRIDDAITVASRYDLTVGVVTIDIDQFNRINDSLGHPIGDRIIRILAERFAEHLPGGDSVARPGGDAFVAVLTDVANADDVLRAAQRLIDLVRLPVRFDRYELEITASAGAAVFPMDGSNADTLVKNAEAAMYRAKHLGRNRAQLFTADMHDAAVARLGIEHDLRGAETRGELFLEYQPVVDVVTNEIVSVEALVRWRHPSRGLVQPGDFIHLAEETGLIIAIGMWVLESACTFATTWPRNGKSGAAVSVNISANQFAEIDLVDQVMGVIEKTGIEPSRLQLELTESAIIEDPSSAIEIIKRLNGLGIRIALDDFGTGFSSLSYLSQFAIDTLKIDRSFVRDILTSPRDEAIVKTIIALAGILEMRVIAEGVETKEQMDTLQQFGCRIMQGYYFTRPVSAARLMELLEGPTG